LDISPTALITAERRAKDARVGVNFAVADYTKLDGYIGAFGTVIDSGMSTKPIWHWPHCRSRRASVRSRL
jgi:hypothetical protein